MTIKTVAFFSCGEYDEATPAACRDFAAMTPNARVEVIPDASHMAFAEQREPYMKVVRAFLAEHEPA